MALAILIAGVALTLAAVAIAEDPIDEDSGMLAWAISASLLGVFIVWKVRENRFSWLLLTTGVLGGLAGVAPLYLPEVGSRSVTDSEAWAEGLGALAFFGFFWLTVAVIPLLFPTGRPLNRWWGLGGWLGVVGLAAGLPLMLLTEAYCTTASNGTCAVWAINPHGVKGMPHIEYSDLGFLMLGLVMLSMAGGVVSLVVRMVRSRGVERHQTKWLVVVTVLMLTLVIVDGVAQALVESWIEPGGVLAFLFGVLPWLMLPVAITIAITKYRLYDIDRILSRTVSYAVLVVLLAGVFAGGILVFSIFLGRDNSLVVAGSTLGAAALFSPLRTRVQRLMDRRFNRSRYVAELVRGELAASLRDAVDPDRVVGLWLESVAETVQPQAVTVWMKP